MSEAHNMAIIGFGGMANYHFENLQKYDRVKVKGIDRKSTRLNSSH